MKPLPKPEPETETETLILSPSRRLTIAGEYRSKTFLLVDAISLKMSVKFIIRIKQAGDSALKPVRHFVQVWQVTNPKETVREVTDRKANHCLSTFPLMFSDAQAIEKETRRIAKEFSL